MWLCASRLDPSIILGEPFGSLGGETSSTRHGCRLAGGIRPPTRVGSAHGGCLIGERDFSLALPVSHPRDDGAAGLCRAEAESHQREARRED